MFDSLPFGEETAETQIAPELCEAAAERFYQQEPQVSDFDSPDIVLWWIWEGFHIFKASYLQISYSYWFDATPFSLTAFTQPAFTVSPKAS